MNCLAGRPEGFYLLAWRLLSVASATPSGLTCQRGCAEIVSSSDLVCRNCALVCLGSGLASATSD